MTWDRDEDAAMIEVDACCAWAIRVIGQIDALGKASCRLRGFLHLANDREIGEAQEYFFAAFILQLHPTVFPRRASKHAPPSRHVSNEGIWVGLAKGGSMCGGVVL